MVSHHALRTILCRRGFFYKAGLDRLVSVNCASRGFATDAMAKAKANLDSNILAFPSVAAGTEIKTDVAEVNTILEEMKMTGDITLHQRLSDAVSSVSSIVIEERKKELLYTDPELYSHLNNAHQSSLLTRQIDIEEQQQSAAVTHYNESLKELISMGRGTGLKYVQRVLLKWYEPLTRVLDAEISLIEKRVTGPDRTVRTRAANCLDSLRCNTYDLL